ncbi:MAG: metalloregulator ArsR/SmtB family transcription factor [Bryobacterales bacterium]|nr:metalloregulator ArsR/SmtB family transcription factor [Bryobacterales bacterium]
MAGLVKALKLLGDESRLRLLRLLAREELSVGELQEILGMGQSRISMQLAQLKQAGLVELRRSGQRSLYRFNPERELSPPLRDILKRTGQEIAEASSDDDALALILSRRKDTLRAHFDELAGRFGRHYVPGRSWQGLAETLLRILPPMVIADLGAGEGSNALHLSRRAERVIAVDNSERMVAYGRSLARKYKVKNLDYRLGDLEDLPIESSSCHIALFHQSLHHVLHPERAVAEAARILLPGGRVAIVDLMRHRFEQARELYAHVWLGFSQPELLRFLREAGLVTSEITIVHREEEPPHFETLLAVAQKPA